MINIKPYINIPNALSFYRLLSFPFVMFFALNRYENIFVILLVINLITDVLDGMLARLLRQQTEFGAKLDAFADFGMYITAILGIIIFKAEELAPHFLSFSIFIIVYIIPKIISFLKFRTFPSLHLYSSKIGGYMQGFFFFVLFVFDFYVLFYYIMIIWGILSFLEQIIIVSITSEPKSNAKGLYWIFKTN